MNRFITLALLIAAATMTAAAAPVPEIDPASGASAIAVLSGAALIIRARARR